MRPLRERFEAKVDRTGPHHLWMGAKQANGIGVLKVDGKVVTTRRVAWELAHGPLPAGARVMGCPDEPACVRVDHMLVSGMLSNLEQAPKPAPRRHRTHGTGSKVKLRDGVYKLTVTAGRYADGSRRRVHETVYARNDTEADDELARFAVEVRGAPLPNRKADLNLTVDEGIERYLTEHLLGEKGREESTVKDYRALHEKWFSPEIGHRRIRDVTEEMMDRLFGQMRRAGLSASRMNHARSLYTPFFRWAKRRRIIRRNPMADFDLPTSIQIAREHTPPEVEQLALYLQTALDVVPDVTPVLTLGAVTGMRRGELVSLRRSRLFPDKGMLTVDASPTNDGKRVKSTKTRKERDVAVDDETMAMLLRHCELMDERAAVGRITLGPDAFIFSLEPDCSTPMPAEHLTKQVAKLKDHLGIADKRPETIALEDEALGLYRQKPAKRPKGRTGPAPRGGMSFDEIGRRLKRSGRWARLAVAAAERREAAGAKLGTGEIFDGSIIALRKFTSSELLDAGFNISMVARRQGHGPQVLIKHYAKGRRSADRKAAAHLGKVVHGN